jgi:hypothetical protein
MKSKEDNNPALTFATSKTWWFTTTHISALLLCSAASAAAYTFEALLTAFSRGVVSSVAERALSEYGPAVSTKRPQGAFYAAAFVADKRYPAAESPNTRPKTTHPSRDDPQSQLDPSRKPRSLGWASRAIWNARLRGSI